MSAIDILFESNQIIVITKPAGIISEHNKFEADNAEALVRAHLSEKVKTPFVGITHRLDRVTSGILLMTKRPGTLKTVNQWFENRQIKKTYLAITSSAPELDSGLLEHHLWTDLEQKKAMVVSGKERCKACPVKLPYIGGHRLWLFAGNQAKNGAVPSNQGTIGLHRLPNHWGREIRERTALFKATNCAACLQAGTSSSNK